MSIEYKFDAVKVKNEIVEDIRNWFDKNGKDCNAVIGISGGKDSTITAALCVEALEADRVIGILMPNGEQTDIEEAEEIIKLLGIGGSRVNIEDIYYDFLRFIPQRMRTEQSETNLPPRIRSAMLYFISQAMNGE